MALSGGEKVGKVPHVDQGKPPKRIEFTPEEKKKIAEKEVELLEYYPRQAEEFKKRFPKLDAVLAGLKPFEDYAEGIKQPTTSGPREVETYDVKFRIELLDKKGHIVGYHDIKPKHPVTSYQKDAPAGRMSVSYDGYENIASMAMDESYGYTQYRTRFLIELDNKDMAKLDATSKHLKSTHKGRSVRIVVIGGPVKK